MPFIIFIYIASSLFIDRILSEKIFRSCLNLQVQVWMAAVFLTEGLHWKVIVTVSNWADLVLIFVSPITMKLTTLYDTISGVSGSLILPLYSSKVIMRKTYRLKDLIIVVSLNVVV